MISKLIATMTNRSKTYSFHRYLVRLIALFLLPGCSTHKVLTLMPKPVIYENAAIDPFDHLTAEHKNTRMHVFYATNRSPRFSDKDVSYGNAWDSSLHLGEATIRMGEPDTDWDELLASSMAATHLKAVPLTLETISETAQIPEYESHSNHRLTPDQQIFIDAINRELEKAIDKEIMIYVHGTKVDFANAAILTAEINHFAGRDFVGLAFAWPSHQNILYYLLGTDVRRAVQSSSALTDLLVLLADHTEAEHINILAYSAGGKVASKALFDLRRAFPEMDPNALQSQFRIASVVFAAVDVAIDKFLGRLPAISDMADQVVVTVTDKDNALNAAKMLMGGEVRAGTLEAEGLEETFIVKNNLSNVEIIDVSFGQDVRGFDITGHHYWYRHPWMSSDIIFLMRTDLPPHRRGLSPTELEGIWYLSSDYPQKVQQAAIEELQGKW